MIEGPIHMNVSIRPDGGPVRFHLVCTTMFLCSYRIDLQELGTGASVVPFPVSGNNLTAKEAMFHLPVPPARNAGRRLFLTISVIDQSGEGGDYTIVAEFLQDDNCLGSMTTGRQKLEGEGVDVVMIAGITAGRRI